MWISTMPTAYIQINCLRLTVGGRGRRFRWPAAGGADAAAGAGGSVARGSGSVTWATEVDSQPGPENRFAGPEPRRAGRWDFGGRGGGNTVLPRKCRLSSFP